MKINNKKIDVQIMGQHFVVFYKDEILFKVSNNVDNAIQLLKLINN